MSQSYSKLLHDILVSDVNKEIKNVEKIASIEMSIFFQ